MTALAAAAAAAVAAAVAVDELAAVAAAHADPALAGDLAAALSEPGEGALAAVAARADGSPGAAVFLLSHEGAHRLAAVMMGAAPGAPVAEGPLTELEHAAVADATDRLLAAAGDAAGTPLGDSRLGPAAADALAQMAGSTAQATACDFEVCGQPARLVLLAVGSRGGAASAASGPRGALGESLKSTTVRLSAEVGRTRLPVERLVGVPPGTVIELDRDASDPIDLYVNGRRFALGRLELTDTGEWAVRVERVLDPDEI